MKKLALLVRRSLKGWSIKRCQAVDKEGMQCCQFGSVMRGDVIVCPVHNRYAAQTYVSAAPTPALLTEVQAADSDIMPTREEITTPRAEPSRAEPSRAEAMEMKPLMRIADVVRAIPISRATIWRWASEGTFPKPVKISAGVTVWRREDIVKYIENGNWAI